MKPGPFYPNANCACAVITRNPSRRFQQERMRHLAYLDITVAARAVTVAAATAVTVSAAAVTVAAAVMVAEAAAVASAMVSPQSYFSRVQVAYNILKCITT